MGPDRFQNLTPVERKGVLLFASARLMAALRARKRAFAAGSDEAQDRGHWKFGFSMEAVSTDGIWLKASVNGGHSEAGPSLWGHLRGL